MDERGSSWCSVHVKRGSDEIDLEANLEFHGERLRPVAETLLRWADAVNAHCLEP